MSPISSPPLRAVRLGLRQVRGLAAEEADRLVAARTAAGGVQSFETLVQAAQLSRRTVELLAEADAFRSLGLDRRAALWMVKGLQTRDLGEAAPLLARMGGVAETAPELPRLSLPEHVAEDYRTTSLSLKAHPCRFFRERLARQGVKTTREATALPNGRRVRTAGLVLIRQRPGTAKGVTFVTIEDETGVANLVVWKDRFEANRRTVMTARLLQVEGRIQRENDVVHLVAERFDDLSAWLQEMREGEVVEVGKSRDFH